MIKFIIYVSTVVFPIFVDAGWETGELLEEIYIKPGVTRILEQDTAFFTYSDSMFDYDIRTDPKVKITIECSIRLPCATDGSISALNEATQKLEKKCSKGDGYEPTGKMEFTEHVYVHISGGKRSASGYSCKVTAGGILIEDTCKCGRNFVGKIVGGRPAKAGEFPWLVALSFEQKGFYCGGSILSEKYVVTAAHCLSDSIKSKVTIFAGTLQKDQGERYRIGKVWRHEEYDSTYYYNDITLAQTEKPFVFTGKIYPICLPRNMMKETFAMKFLDTAGFGRIEEDGAKPNILLMTKLRGMSFEKCIENYYYGRVVESMLCAWERYTDTCEGDSGGPLSYQASSGIHYLVGITSWGDRCGSFVRAGVYTRVTSFIDWIDRKTNRAICSQ